MTRSRWVLMLLVLACSAAGRSLSAQGSRAPEPPIADQVRSLMSDEKLPEMKGQLRDEIAQLRDSLYIIGSIRSRIGRARASSMSAVALSLGRQLAGRCRMGAAMTDLTTSRLATLRTSEPLGDRALDSYRAALRTLSTALRDCEHQSGAAAALMPPDAARFEEIATKADAAITQHDQVRDGMLHTFAIHLPVHGYIPPPRPN